MKSRWTDKDAREAVQQWGPEIGEDFALRLYTARLIGEDPRLVLHGGGNVSLKGRHRALSGNEVDAIHVKASGWDLATIEPAGMPDLDLARLRDLRTLRALTDRDMVKQIRTLLFDPWAPNPSIETLVHAFLPHRFVDHSHADAVLAVTNQRNGEAMTREAVGAGVAIIPYVRPGFELAKAVVEAYEADPKIDAVVLLHHGLITFDDDAQSAYERHIALVDACEQFARQRGRGRPRTRGWCAQDNPAGPAPTTAMYLPLSAAAS